MTSRTILITGATSGIGARTARLLLDRGHRVAVTGRDETKLKAFLDAAGHPDRLLGLVADAAHWQATQSAVTHTVERFGALHAAVANAGFVSADDQRTPGATVSDGDPTLWPPMVLTNVLGPALLAKATLPHLEATGGRLVLIGSVVGVKNAPASLYSATKWAVTGLAENLRMHATARGIGVTLVNPGVIDTPFWQDGSTPPFALPPQPVAEAVCFALDQPAGVDLNTLTIRPIGQPT
ncbi:SDR family oxidoreductase [Streptomyces sp. NPDC057877]|uniref:SDR family oxidoreductase n=1 Tax=Streptomyces sp. NPDC057877 TaxID=3346269 RepID=UPI0036C03764